jgi:hypothetical protein
MVYINNKPARLYPPNGFLRAAKASDYRLGSELLWKKVFFDNHHFMLGGNFDKIKLFDTTIEQNTKLNPSEFDSLPGGWMDPEENYHYSVFMQDQFNFFNDESGLKITDASFLRIATDVIK